MSAPTRRRSPSKGDRKQEALLDTAERLLATKSLAEIGIEELAAGAGISRSSFYFYFESKQAMLLALLAKVSDGLMAEVGSWLTPGNTDTREEVRRSIGLAVQMYADHGAVLLAAQSSDAPAQARRFMAELNGRLVEASADAIERKRAEGYAPPGPPSARVLADMLVGMAEHCISHCDPEMDRDELVESLTTIWMRAIFVSDQPDC